MKRINSLLCLTLVFISSNAFAASEAIVELSPSPSFKSKDGRYSFKLGGYTQFDMANVSGIQTSDRGLVTGTRNARINLSGSIDNTWSFKLENNFTQDGSVLNSAYISYNGFKPLTIQLGRFVHNTFMENSTGLRNITFLETAYVSSFAVIPNNGINLTYAMRDGVASLGLASAKVGNDRHKAIAGRITFAPVHTTNEAIHLGLSSSFTAPRNKPGISKYAIKPQFYFMNPLINVQLNDFASSKVAGVEVGGSRGPLSAQAEYAINKVNRIGKKDSNLFAYYVQANYSLTGENRPYNLASGTFNNPSPRTAFDLANKTWGAFEVAMRYNVLNMNHGSIKGGRISDYTLGLNWYPNSNIATSLAFTQASTIQNKKPKILMLRTQLNM
jgi:phosphate-selective porin OprO/OprP